MLDIDSSDHPFECAAILPAQFFADRHKFGEPIERLMFAVLNDAIRLLSNQFWGAAAPCATLVGGN